MGFIFLTRGLWALLALPSASEVSVHKVEKGSVVLGQLTDVLAHSMRTGCVAGLEAVDDPVGLLQVLQGLHSVQCRDCQQ